MTKESLIESLIDQVGPTQEERLLKRNRLSPQSAFSYLEDITKDITCKPKHLRPLYESRESHTMVLRAFYPLFVDDVLGGSKKAKFETKELFESHQVKFNEKNYSTVVSAVLDYVAGLPDKDLSVLRVISGNDPKWPE